MPEMKEVYEYAEQKMQKSIKNQQTEYAGIRAGRANPAVLDKLTVDYYGAQTPINQVAAVSVTEARSLVIQPWDVSILRAVEKAILNSDIGINPQNDGKTLRLIFPPLTEERRRDINKSVSKFAEDTKVAVRSIRRDSIEKLKAMKKKSEITEDDLKDGEKKLQDMTDKYCKQADKEAVAKTAEIMEI